MRLNPKPEWCQNPISTKASHTFQAPSGSTGLRGLLAVGSVRTLAWQAAVCAATGWEGWDFREGQGVLRASSQAFREEKSFLSRVLPEIVVDDFFGGTDALCNFETPSSHYPKPCNLDFNSVVPFMKPVKPWNRFGTAARTRTCWGSRAAQVSKVCELSESTLLDAFT